MLNEQLLSTTKPLIKSNKLENPPHNILIYTDDAILIKILYIKN